MLGERLRGILGEKHITIAEFAEKCDLPVETVKNIYYGKTPDPKISTLMRIADALETNVSCLMGKCLHSKEERAIIHNYRSCGKHGKSIIELIAKYEASTMKTKREGKTHQIPCIIPHGDIRNGIIYDLCETIEIITDIENAYVGIQMVNNDLAPMYCKGDILLFENRFPANGEIASFYQIKKGIHSKICRRKHAI